jgi:predicted nucleic acid-binding protein
VLLDTTFFIDLAAELQARARGPCHAFITAHRHETKHVSVVTLGEYAVGATAAETIRFFRGYRRLSLVRDVAIYAGRFQSTLEFDLGENDLWIAATARYYGLRLVSRDRAFHRLSGLRVMSY